MQNSHVSTDPPPGIHTGGRGCWIGRGHTFTYRSCVYLPLKAKGSRSDHALTISSTPSRYFSRRIAGGVP